MEIHDVIQISIYVITLLLIPAPLMIVWNYLFNTNFTSKIFNVESKLTYWKSLWLFILFLCLTYIAKNDF